MLAVFQNPALSGPAILQTVQPDFQHPLSDPRSPQRAPQRAPTTGSLGTATGVDGMAPIEADTDSGVAAGSGFTIIGDQGTSGLEEPENNDFTQTVREELTGRPQDQAVSGDRTNADAGVGEATGSAAEIVRALVNSVPGQSAAGSGNTDTGQSGSGGLVASVIDSTVADLVITLLNPEQTADGMVTFSIAGFGDFALLHLQENNSFFVVDLDGGTAIKVAQEVPSVPAGRVIQRSTGNEQPRKISGNSNALQRVIIFLEDNVLPFIQSPITLATVALFSIIWVIWRLSAQV